MLSESDWDATSSGFLTRAAIIVVVFILIFTMLFGLSRAQRLRAHLEKIMNVSMLVCPLAINLLLSYQLRVSLKELGDNVNLDLLISYVLFTSFFSFFLLSTPAGYTYSVVSVFLSCGSTFLLCVRNTYSVYWFDFARCIISLLTLTAFLYWKERRVREIFLKMFLVMDDEKRWKSILMHMNEAIVAFDENSKIAYKNHAFQSLFDLSTEHHGDQTVESSLREKMQKIKDFKYVGGAENLNNVLKNLDRTQTEPAEVIFSFGSSFISLSPLFCYLS
jgi:PAS domain-containing protein